MADGAPRWGGLPMSQVHCTSVWYTRAAPHSVRHSTRPAHCEKSLRSSNTGLPQTEVTFPDPQTEVTLRTGVYPQMQGARRDEATDPESCESKTRAAWGVSRGKSRGSHAEVTRKSRGSHAEVTRRSRGEDEERVGGRSPQDHVLDTHPV